MYNSSKNNFNKITIGGYTIAIYVKDFPVPIKLNDRYRLFFGGEKKDIKLNLICGKFDTHLQNYTFQTDFPWKLIVNGDEIIYQFFESKNSKTSYITACFNPTYQKGVIYIRPRKSGLPFLADPLGYPLDELLMINFLSHHRGILCHSLGLSDYKNGFLFSGSSGAGKSTLANLWKDQKNIALLSDDRIIIRKKDGRFMIYGTPWHGDAGVASPDSAPLNKIFFIQHAKKNYCRDVKPMDAAARLLVRSFPTFWDKKGMEFTLQFIDEIVRNIPCYELGFVPDKSIVDYVMGIEGRGQQAVKQWSVSN